MSQRTRLDRALAEGADPATDPSLALRARQLTDRSMRRAIAAILGNLVEAAAEPPMLCPPGSARPPLQRTAVLAAREELLALAELLRGSHAVSPQAVALASLLVWDSASPMYTSNTDTSVAEWAGTVIEALNAADTSDGSPTGPYHERLVAIQPPKSP